MPVESHFHTKSPNQLAFMEDPRELFTSVEPTIMHSKPGTQTIDTAVNSPDNQLALYVEQRGPFTVSDRQVNHDKYGMQLIEDTVINPDGSPGKQYWINFPRGAVQIFALDDDGNMYLNDEFTYAENRRNIEGAGGSIEPGETIAEAGAREIGQELGLEVYDMQILPTYGSITSRVNDPTHTLFARVRSVGEAEPEVTEDIRRKVIPFEDVVGLLRNGIITNGVTAAALWHINDILHNEQAASATPDSMPAQGTASDRQQHISGQPSLAPRPFRSRQ